MTHTCPMCGHVFQSEDDFAMPFGIWSPIVLTRPSVKAAFSKD